MFSPGSGSSLNPALNLSTPLGQFYSTCSQNLYYCIRGVALAIRAEKAVLFVPNTSGNQPSDASDKPKFSPKRPTRPKVLSAFKDIRISKNSDHNASPELSADEGDGDLFSDTFSLPHLDSVFSSHSSQKKTGKADRQAIPLLPNKVGPGFIYPSQEAPESKTSMEMMAIAGYSAAISAPPPRGLGDDKSDPLQPLRSWELLSRSSRQEQGEGGSSVNAAAIIAFTGGVVVHCGGGVEPSLEGGGAINEEGSTDDKRKMLLPAVAKSRHTSSMFIPVSLDLDWHDGVSSILPARATGASAMHQEDDRVEGRLAATGGLGLSETCNIGGGGGTSHGPIVAVLALFNKRSCDGRLQLPHFHQQDEHIAKACARAGLGPLLLEAWGVSNGIISPNQTGMAHNSLSPLHTMPTNHHAMPLGIVASSHTTSPMTNIEPLASVYGSRFTQDTAPTRNMNVSLDGPYAQQRIALGATFGNPGNIGGISTVHRLDVQALRYWFDQQYLHRLLFTSEASGVESSPRRLTSTSIPATKHSYANATASSTRRAVRTGLKVDTGHVDGAQVVVGGLGCLVWGASGETLLGTAMNGHPTEALKQAMKGSIAPTFRSAFVYRVGAAENEDQQPAQKIVDSGTCKAAVNSETTFDAVAAGKARSRILQLASKAMPVEPGSGRYNSLLGQQYTTALIAEASVAAGAGQVEATSNEASPAHRSFFVHGRADPDLLRFPAAIMRGGGEWRLKGLEEETQEENPSKTRALPRHIYLPSREMTLARLQTIGPTTPLPDLLVFTQQLLELLTSMAAAHHVALVEQHQQQQGAVDQWRRDARVAEMRLSRATAAEQEAKRRAEDLEEQLKEAREALQAATAEANEYRLMIEQAHASMGNTQGSRVSFCADRSSSRTKSIAPRPTSTTGAAAASLASAAANANTDYLIRFELSARGARRRHNTSSFIGGESGQLGPSTEGTDKKRSSASFTQGSEETAEETLQRGGEEDEWEGDSDAGPPTTSHREKVQKIMEKWEDNGGRANLITEISVD